MVTIDTWKTRRTKIAVLAAILLPSLACGASSIRTGCMIGVASSSGIEEFHLTIVADEKTAPGGCGLCAASSSPWRRSRAREADSAPLKDERNAELLPKKEHLPHTLPLFCRRIARGVALLVR